jgi:hypothetical protein
MSTTHCRRCGDVCQSQPKSTSNARPFRRAQKGNCAACAVCSFFQDVDTGLGFALPANFDPEGLRLPHIQAQFARILELGGSELKMSEIDWDAVIRKWRIA